MPSAPSAMPPDGSGLPPVGKLSCVCSAGAVAVEAGRAGADDRLHDRVAALVGEVVEHADALVALVDEEQVAVRIEDEVRRLVDARDLGRAAVAGRTAVVGEAGRPAEQDAHAAVVAVDRRGSCGCARRRR